MCAKCGKKGDLVLCEGCTKAWHLKCANLTEVPEDDWFCMFCKTSETEPSAEVNREPPAGPASGSPEKAIGNLTDWRAPSPAAPAASKFNPSFFPFKDQDESQLVDLTVDPDPGTKKAAAAATASPQDSGLSGLSLGVSLS